MSDLFDFADEQEDDDLPDWDEVPQARFLSWSEKMQWAYCAARDQDAALRATSLEEFDWFMARSKMYKEMIHEQE